MLQNSCHWQAFHKQRAKFPMVEENFSSYLYRVYQEVPARLVGNVSWVSLSLNTETYPSLKLDSYRDKDKRIFKESVLLHRVESMSGNPVTCCDKAPPHYSRCVREFLHDYFPNCWLSCGRPQTWPPRSPGLTPPDYFLWGYTKSLVSETKVWWLCRANLIATTYQTILKLVFPNYVNISQLDSNQPSLQGLWSLEWLTSQRCWFEFKLWQVTASLKVRYNLVDACTLVLKLGQNRCVLHFGYLFWACVYTEIIEAVYNFRHK
jgi:hypothetical protein